jgi:hypothetical protein
MKWGGQDYVFFVLLVFGVVLAVWSALTMFSPL